MRMVIKPAFCAFPETSWHETNVRWAYLLFAALSVFKVSRLISASISQALANPRALPVMAVNQ